MFDKNKPYTRSEIAKLIGSNEMMGYLPQDGNRKVLAGCINLEGNPDAPKEIQAGGGKIITRKAQELSQQPETEFPVFLRKNRKTNQYRFVGYFRCSGSSTNPTDITVSQSKSHRTNVEILLYLEPSR